MKIIKESKEKLPIEFITQYVSKGWEEVGNLKSGINAIKKEFKDTNKIEDILQDLLDSYLIMIGQMESLLDGKKYLDMPEDKELKEDVNKKLTEAYRNYCVLDVDNNVLYDDYGDDVRKALIDLQSDKKAYSVNRYFTSENGKYVPYNYENVAYKNKDGKIEIYKNNFYSDEWFNCCSGLDQNKIVLHESNEEESQPIKITKQQYDLFNSSKFNGKSTFSDKLINKDNKYFWNGSQQSLNAAIEYFKPLKESSPELAKPVQALKYETEKCKDGKCCKKTEIFTELPDYDVEVEQKGNKVELEVMPKDLEDDEWPEPDLSDMCDIEDARASIASMDVGKPFGAQGDMVGGPVNNKLSTPVKSNSNLIDSDDDWNMDFGEPEADEEADNNIRAWKNNNQAF